MNLITSYTENLINEMVRSEKKFGIELREILDELIERFDSFDYVKARDEEGNLLIESNYLRVTYPSNDRYNELNKIARGTVCVTTNVYQTEIMISDFNLLVKSVYEYC